MLACLSRWQLLLSGSLRCSNYVELPVRLNIRFTLSLSVVALAPALLSLDLLLLLGLQLLLDEHELFLREVSESGVQREQVHLLTLGNRTLQGLERFLLGRFPHS